MNLNQITLPVKNIELSNQFYQTLGFNLIVKSDHYSRFECPQGDSTFSLSHDENEFKNGATIYFENENLDEWVNQLKAKGIVFKTEPTDQSYLWREAELYDPSGNKIKLYWAGENRLNPPWRVNN